MFNVCTQDDRQMHVYALIEMDVPYFYPLEVICFQNVCKKTKLNCVVYRSEKKPLFKTEFVTKHNFICTVDVFI